MRLVHDYRDSTLHPAVIYQTESGYYYELMLYQTRPRSHVALFVGDELDGSSEGPYCIMRPATVDVDVPTSVTDPIAWFDQLDYVAFILEQVL